MSLRRRALLPLTCALLVTVAACGGDDDSGDDAEPTTAAAVTTVADTVAPDETAAPDDTAEPDDTDAPDGSVDPAQLPEFIDPATILTPWDGVELQPIDADAVDSLVTGLANDPDDEVPVVAVGATEAVDADGVVTRLLFIDFAEELGAALAQEFVDGATETASDVTEVDANGTPGYAFLDSDGAYGFVSVRGRTAVVATSDDADALQATVTAMLEANPAL